LVAVARRRSSGRSAVLLLAVLGVAVLGLSGCGTSSSGPNQTASASLSPGRGRSHHGDPSARHHATVAERSPALLALRRALQAGLLNAGPEASAAIYDLTDHRLLFEHRADVRSAPASVEKLFTTVAVLQMLGPNATLPTQVLGAGHLGRGGVWHGDVYLKGGGDPTFGDAGFNQTYEHGYGPTAAALVQQLAARGIHRITGLLIPDESLFDSLRGGLLTKYAPDIPDIGGQLSALTYDHGSALTIKASPAVFAARQVAATMSSMGIMARAAKQPAVTPAGAQQLASVASPTIETMLKLMNVPSDDLFAELLIKQLGVRFGGGVGSIAAGAAVVSQTLATDYGIHPLVQDGSGLSHGDRASPLEVIKLLRELWGTATGRALVASLPVLGINGTVRHIALKTAAVGRCVAKTGTLNYVTNLAGYCHARGGHMLAFALFVPGPSNYVAIPVIGDMVAAVARY
jgi:D-alanyl-D-alanine carboxypeptidase/D-alanyl-D-alanine-endopeptidase (penicillin-binding protein 4)